MGKVVELEDAVKLIKDGDTITSSGGIGVLNPEEVLSALEATFLSEGHPRDLTLFEPNAISLGPAFEHFVHEGFLKRRIMSVMASDFDPEGCQAILDNKVEAYAIPLGVANQLPTHIARKSPGLLSKVGLYTFVDPRLHGGKCNSVTTEDLVKLVQYEGDEYLLYKTFPIDVAIVRGTTADEEGNISFENEALSGCAFYLAMAAKNSGGKVICQVKRVVPSGGINPRMVEIPGVLVDAVVVAEDQRVHERFPDGDEPGLDGQTRVSPPPCAIAPLDEDKAAARRAALEIRRGDVVNLGGGVPTTRLAPLTLEEDFQDLFVVSREHGVLGGVSYGRDVHINPTSFLSYEDLFNWYAGGALDLVILGCGEADEEGNVNLTRFGPMFRGPGGAPDLAEYAKRLVYVTTFTRDGLKTSVGAGRIIVVREGRAKKFVKRVQHITISGRYLAQQGRDVLFITERAVFRLRTDGLELIEIAPGIDLQRDVLAQMEFAPMISDSLREMDARIFTEGLMGLRRDLLGHEEEDRVRPVPLVPLAEMEERPYWTSRSAKR